MNTNSFVVSDESLTAIGSALYLTASVFDHSCRPNAVATFDGCKIMITAQENIPDFEWNKIRLNYIDLLDSKIQRRDYLKKQYYFDCECRRCGDLEETQLEDGIVCGENI